jgi:hypothetical protein
LQKASQARTFRHLLYPALPFLSLVLAATACVFMSSPAELNDGRGTRQQPIPKGIYAKTLDYEVTVLSVDSPQQDKDSSGSSQSLTLRVQFQVRCLKQADQVCQLQEIARHLKLVDEGGILYDPVFVPEIEDPLEGEILGDAVKAGWLVYQIPHGVSITLALAEYGQDQRVFFQLP